MRSSLRMDWLRVAHSRKRDPGQSFRCEHGSVFELGRFAQGKYCRTVTNITNVSNPIDVRDDVLRIDHKFSDKWTVLGHWMHDNVVQGYAQPELGWLWASYNTVTSTLSNPSKSAAIKLSGTINPNLLVEASMNYDGNVIDILDSRSPICLRAGPEHLLQDGQPVSAEALPASVDLTTRPKIWDPHHGTTQLKITSPRSIFRTPWASTP